MAGWAWRFSTSEPRSGAKSRSLASAPPDIQPSQAVCSRARASSRSTAVSKAKAQDRNYVLIAELNNHPRTSFLAKIRNPHPSLAHEPERQDHHG